MEQITLKLFSVIFIGGGIGASLRWIISLFSYQLSGKFWLGTIFVNLAGCILYYLVAKYAIWEVRLINPAFKVGFLGSLTTFSTFSYELVILMKQARYYEALLVFCLNVLAGVLIGIWIFR